MLDTIVQKDDLIRLDGLHRLDYIGNKQACKDSFMTVGRRGGVLHRWLGIFEPPVIANRGQTEEIEVYMQGIFLKFYVSEYREHNGILLFEWLLERAKKIGIHGGTAVRAIAGFGRHGILHEETLLELTSDLPVEVGFVLSEEESRRFMDLLQAENIDLFYVRFPVEYGFLPE